MFGDDWYSVNPNDSQKSSPAASTVATAVCCFRLFGMLNVPANRKNDAGPDDDAVRLGWSKIPQETDLPPTLQAIDARSGRKRLYQDITSIRPQINADF